MYAYELDRLLRREGAPLASIAYDPGFLPDTGMGSGAPSIFRTTEVRFILRNLGMTMGKCRFPEALKMLAQDATYAGSSGKC